MYYEYEQRYIIMSKDSCSVPDFIWCVQRTQVKETSIIISKILTLLVHQFFSVFQDGFVIFFVGFLIVRHFRLFGVMARPPCHAMKL